MVERLFEVVHRASITENACNQACKSVGMCVNTAQRMCSTVSLEYFAGEKSLRISQISRKFDPLRSSYRIAGKFRGVKIRST